MRRKICAILGSILLFALCVAPGCASGLTGIDLPPLHFPLTIRIISPAPEKTSAVVGETISAAWTVTGGSPPYEKVSSYWTMNDDPTPVFELGATSPENYINSISFTKPATARFWVKVQDDSTTQTASTEIITITQPSPLSIAIQFDKAFISPGQTIQGSWQVTGGVPPYQEVLSSWSVYSKGVYTPTPFKAGSASGSDKLSPLAGEKLSLVITVKDAAQKFFSQQSVWIPILNPIPITISLPPLSKTAVTLGDIVTGAWSVTGGNLPYQSVLYQWRVLSGGKTVPTPFGTGAAEGYHSFWPKEGDQLSLSVTVTDAGLYTENKYTETIPILAVRRGDSNQDQSVDILDLVSIIEYIVDDTFPMSMTNSDANADKAVDILDLVWIIDLIVG